MQIPDGLCKMETQRVTADHVVEDIVVRRWVLSEQCVELNVSYTWP